jgi:hypothetical protein
LLSIPERDIFRVQNFIAEALLAVRFKATPKLFANQHGNDA